MMCSSPKNKATQAFTLIEISIVLTIMALLIGGVIAGQSLVRASELRAFTTQYQGIVTALDAFKDKYGWIPGDMPDATGYFGAAAAGAACVTTASTTLTCDGNGDKLITDAGVGGQSSNELFRFWQHLALAGFIPGSFDGVSGNATTYWVISNTNSPKGKISRGYWFTYNWSGVLNSASFFDGSYENSLQFGVSDLNGDSSIPIFKPEELWNIDTKIDDGKPATGKLKLRGAISSCTDTSASGNMAANYLVNNNTVACAAMFPRAY